MVVSSGGEDALVAYRFSFPFSTERRDGTSWAEGGGGVGDLEKASARGGGCIQEAGEGYQETSHCGDGAKVYPA